MAPAPNLPAGALTREGRLGIMFGTACGQRVQNKEGGTTTMKRGSGILLHISSLPSPHGIGTLGRAAYDFADRLKAAGQRYWQVLPLGPTSYGDSPYQSFSSFAGNPYFIDLELLAEDGLLTPAELEGISWGDDPEQVDYGAIYQNRFPVLRRAYARGWQRDRAAVEAFAEGRTWLQDYALFMALKGHFGMESWIRWPDRAIRLREPEAVVRYRKLLAEDVQFYTYLQYLFFRQWSALKAYINGLGIRLIGDVPIYVALDSADVWSEPQFFQLDSENRPVEVSGVPPDYFCADGQLWGNPLYDYERMRADGYGWWIRRMDGVRQLFDVVRFDHFRGLESYWAVPYGDKTARNGRWRKGPGLELVRVLTSWFGDLELIAEDLGFLTPAVHQLLAESGLPGMKVLEFAFDPREPSSYLPHTYGRNCVCYVGTHDNETLVQWEETVDREHIRFAREYLGLAPRQKLNQAMIRAGMQSVADLFIVPMQDLLELGAQARMNAPGTDWGNWRWRMLPGAFDEALCRRLGRWTEIYGRAAAPEASAPAAGREPAGPLGESGV